MSKNIFSYSDESGNTGNSIFDKAQPYFWTGTLISPNDLENDNNIIQLWKNKLYVSEIHGSELGLNGIEIIADEIRSLIQDRDCFFIFTRIEKEHVAATKLVDTLMDSGINKGVSHLHYGVKILRLPIALCIIEQLDYQDRLEFWQVYETGDSLGFCKILGRLAWRIKQNVGDQRLKELIIDAISWAIKYPDPLLEATRSKLDAPNMIAFSLLIDGIHNLITDSKYRIFRFIFDEQDQFGKTMSELFTILHRIKFSSNNITFMVDAEEVDTFNCSIEMIPSHTSAGLQLIDIILWLLKRNLEKPFEGYPLCEKLTYLIMAKGVINSFTFKELKKDVFHRTRHLYHCKACGYQASLTAGTVFHKTRRH